MAVTVAILYVMQNYSLDIVCDAKLFFEHFMSVYICLVVQLCH